MTDGRDKFFILHRLFYQRMIPVGWNQVNLILCNSPALIQHMGGKKLAAKTREKEREKRRESVAAEEGFPETSSDRKAKIRENGRKNAVRKAEQEMPISLQRIPFRWHIHWGILPWISPCPLPHG